MCLFLPLKSFCTFRSTRWMGVCSRGSESQLSAGFYWLKLKTACFQQALASQFYSGRKWRWSFHLFVLTGVTVDRILSSWNNSTSTLLGPLYGLGGFLSALISPGSAGWDVLLQLPADIPTSSYHYHYYRFRLEHIPADTGWKQCTPWHFETNCTHSHSHLRAI